MSQNSEIGGWLSWTHARGPTLVDPKLEALASTLKSVVQPRGPELVDPRPRALLSPFGPKLFTVFLPWCNYGIVEVPSLGTTIQV